jgi:hypothetical protein
LTGVQARHYDGHDYLPEKRMALEILMREVCEVKSSKTQADVLQKSAWHIAWDRRAMCSAT